MPCDRALAITTDGNWLRVVPVRCKCWQCETCGPIQLHKLRRRIAEGNPDMLLTLTCKPRDEEFPADAARRMMDAWKILRKRWQRRHSLKALPFFLIVEATKKGWPHFHIALRAPFVEQKWLSAEWEQLTGAHRVDVRRIRNPRGAIRYLTKYLTKSPARFSRVQRFSSSRNWSQAEQENVEKPRKVETRILSGFDLCRYVALVRAAGWTITRSSKNGFEAVSKIQNATPPLWAATEEVSSPLRRLPDHSTANALPPSVAARDPPAPPVPLHYRSASTPTDGGRALAV